MSATKKVTPPKRTFFRVVMPQSFSNYEFDTRVEAQRKLDGLDSFLVDTPSPVDMAYWKDIQAKAYIVKVTETTERI